MSKSGRTPPFGTPRVSRDEFGDSDEPREPTAVRELGFIIARIQRLELRDANHFGIEGQDGAWQRHQNEFIVMKTDVDVLKGFRAKFLLIVSIGGVLFGAVAELASHLIGKALG